MRAAWRTRSAFRTTSSMRRTSSRRWSSIISPANIAPGRTPNPCVMCNEKLKFGNLLTKARALGATHIATGHYARIERDADGRATLLKAVDAKKDQSYFLFSLRQEQLAASILPLGGLTKPETRALAKKMGLKTYDKEDSQEICFVPGNDYTAFPQVAPRREGFSSRRHLFQGRHEDGRPRGHRVLHRGPAQGPRRRTRPAGLRHRHRRGDAARDRRRLRRSPARTIAFSRRPTGARTGSPARPRSRRRSATIIPRCAPSCIPCPATARGSNSSSRSARSVPARPPSATSATASSAAAGSSGREIVPDLRAVAAVSALTDPHSHPVAQAALRDPATVARTIKPAA